MTRNLKISLALMGVFVVLVGVLLALPSVTGTGERSAGAHGQPSSIEPTR